MTAKPQTLMNPREFAEHVGRSRRAIRIWVDSGRISPAALVGGKVWVEKALPELLLSLDERKQNHASNPRPISGGGKGRNSATLARRRLADAKYAELKAAKLQLELSKEKGRWLEREAAEKAWGKELAEEIQAIEYWLLDRASKELAAEFNLDWRLVSAKLRKIWYQFRQERSDKHTKEAAE
jgi:hypothetical protein